MEENAWWMRNASTAELEYGCRVGDFAGTSWLVELHQEGRTRYMYVNKHGRWWTEDPNKAARFESKKSAMAAAENKYLDADVRFCEHEWI